MAHSQQLCLSYEQTLNIPGVTLPLWGSWGVNGTCTAKCKENCNKHCGKPWDRRQREMWRRAIWNAQRKIQRVIGTPICEQEVCDEIHRIDCPIYLNHKPVLFLGKRVYGELVEKTLQYGLIGNVNNNDPCPLPESEIICADDYFGWVILTEADIPEGFTIDDLCWNYCPTDCPEHILLEQPCVYETVDEEENPIWVAIWPKYQLIHPQVECTDITVDANFLECVCFQTCLVDPDLAITPVNKCDCCKKSCGCWGACLHNDEPGEVIFTAVLGDPATGEVCITPLCTCAHTYVKITYTTGLTCYGENSDLYEAIVKLALTSFTQNSDLCSCDLFGEYLKYWLEEDPSARQAFAKQLIFGSSRAGLFAQRAVNIYLERPLINNIAYSRTGGMLTVKKKPKLHW